jgi:nucleotide-binding universal stress UspA family protein
MLSKESHAPRVDGYRGVERLVLGSDAEYILRHSPVPLLLLRGCSED